MTSKNDNVRIEQAERPAEPNIAPVRMSEGDAWREMPFYSRVDGKTNAWTTPPANAPRKGDSASLECAWGCQAALELINHVRTYNIDQLSTVAEDMIKRGVWGYHEIGFFTALSDYIIRGEIWIGCGGFAKPLFDCAPNPPGSADQENPVNPIVDLFNRFRELHAEAGQCDRNHMDKSFSKEKREKFYKRIFGASEEADDLAKVVTETPSTSPNDLRAKLEIVLNKAELVQDQAPEDSVYPGDTRLVVDGLRSAIADIDGVYSAGRARP